MDTDSGDDLCCQTMPLTDALLQRPALQIASQEAAHEAVSCSVCVHHFVHTGY